MPGYLGSMPLRRLGSAGWGAFGPGAASDGPAAIRQHAQQFVSLRWAGLGVGRPHPCSGNW